jgi:hypothetical protein
MNSVRNYDKICNVTQNSVQKWNIKKTVKRCNETSIQTLESDKPAKVNAQFTIFNIPYITQGMSYFLLFLDKNTSDLYHRKLPVLNKAINDITYSL